MESHVESMCCSWNPWKEAIFVIRAMSVAAVLRELSRVCEAAQRDPPIPALCWSPRSVRSDGQGLEGQQHVQNSQEDWLQPGRRQMALVRQGDPGRLRQ